MGSCSWCLETWGLVTCNSWLSPLVTIRPNYPEWWHSFQTSLSHIHTPVDFSWRIWEYCFMLFSCLLLLKAQMLLIKRCPLFDKRQGVKCVCSKLSEEQRTNISRLQAIIQKGSWCLVLWPNQPIRGQYGYLLTNQKREFLQVSVWCQWLDND